MTALDSALARMGRHLAGADLVPRLGRVTQVLGLAVEATGVDAAVGDLCEIRSPGRRLPAEVAGLRGRHVILMPLGDVHGVGPGSTVRAGSAPLRIPVGRNLLGRVIDGLGRPLDGREPPAAEDARPIHQGAPPALARRRITEPLPTGIRALDGLLPIGRGQRVGIFAGSGVGKSMLLGTLAGRAQVDVSVIGLVGERGREVREFVERDLGAAALTRSVVVVATADEPPLLRRQAAFAATVVAEWFRDQGASVLLMMDSLTRLAMAQREIGLAVGEPPATRGYTPSVFALLPRLLERAGTTAHRGSITGIYTVLVEGDDLADPVADALRAILDGHIVLSRDLAASHHYPAIDVLGSVSRLAHDLLAPEEVQAGARVREWLAAYRDARDLINVGAYVPGTDARVDAALAALDAVTAFLRQDRQEASPRAETLARLRGLAAAPPAPAAEGPRP